MALKKRKKKKKKTVVMIHPSNPITNLTNLEIKGLFTGKTRNWRDVGGKDAPVLIVWGKNAPTFEVGRKTP